MLEIREILSSLSLRRPVFHSEADFQHALAWEIHTVLPDARIRLEFPVAVDSSRIYVDIWVEYKGKVVMAELKYKTRDLSVQIGSEQFLLKNQSAQDMGRYDFLRDIQRLEQVSFLWRKHFSGYAVFLTNDSAYWQPPSRGETIDEAFRIHEGQLITGGVGWKAGASDGTKKNREGRIVLSGKYKLHWTSYSHYNASRYREFRILVVGVTGQKGG